MIKSFVKGVKTLVTARKEHKGLTPEYVKAIAKGVVARSGIEANVVVEESFMVSQSHFVAYVMPLQDNTIYISRKTLSDPEFVIKMVSLFGSIEVAIDAIVSHELGHLSDPNLKTLAMLRDSYINPIQIRYEADMMLEKNAWNYGKFFTSFPEAYDKYNELNMESYQNMWDGRLAALRDEAGK